MKQKKTSADYLITSKVTHGKCNFWGYLLIPFFEPVKTRIGIETCIIDLQKPKKAKKIETFKKKTEWRFAKLTIFDAVFDAAIFGRRWHRKAWCETVVPDALAEAVAKISMELNPQIAQKTSP